MFKVFASVVLVVALVVAIVPAVTNCGYDGKTVTLASGAKVPMKCTWASRAELALAIPLFGVGAIMVGSKRKETIRGLSVLGVVIGAMVMLVPTKLIGVCSHPDAVCNSVMKPSMLVTGIVLVGVCATAFGLNERKHDNI